MEQIAESKPTERQFTAADIVKVESLRPGDRVYVRAPFAPYVPMYVQRVGKAFNGVAWAGLGLLEVCDDGASEVFLDRKGNDSDLITDVWMAAEADRKAEAAEVEAQAVLQAASLVRKRTKRALENARAALVAFAEQG